MLQSSRECEELNAMVGACPEYQIGPEAPKEGNGNDLIQLKGEARNEFIGLYIALQQRLNAQNNLFRAYVISSNFRDAFVYSQASSLFLRFNGQKFSAIQGFKTAPSLNLQDFDVSELESVLNGLSMQQNLEIDFEGRLGEAETANEVGKTLGAFFSAVPSDRFIRLSLPNLEESKTVTALCEGIRGEFTPEFKLDVNASCRELEALAGLPINCLRVEDYDESVDYDAAFSGLNAEIIKASQIPLSLFGRLEISPNPSVKILKVKFTDGLDKPFATSLGKKLTSNFPNLDEFNLDEIYNTVNNPEHGSVLHRMANSCQILSTLEMGFRILAKIKFYHNSTEECKNYETLQMNGFGRRRSGLNNYMICDGTNSFELSLYSMA